MMGDERKDTGGIRARGRLGTHHRPIRASAHTMLPITAPDAKETSKPREMDVRHASAVRALEEVAMIIPAYPATADSREPST